MAGVDYERVLCVKPTVHVFRIPPRTSNRGYRAADWKLDAPDWTGRMRVVALGKDLSIKLEDRNSGELFARCPIEVFPSNAVEAVTDSSRYFVLRIMDDNGRSAFIGIGFEDRGDSFDLNVALQDHFKHVEQEKTAKKDTEDLNKGPKLDLGFKEGQTIRINISTKKGTEENGGVKKSRPKPASGGGLGLLPPPPGGVKLPPPGGHGLGGASASQPQANPQTSQSFGQGQSSNIPPNMNFNMGTASTSGSHSGTQSGGFNMGVAGSNSGGASSGSNVDLLLDLGMDSFSSNSSTSQSMPAAGSSQSAGGQSQNLFDSSFDLLTGSSSGSSVQPAGDSADPWGDFTSASTPSTNSSEDNWVQF